MNDHFTPEKFEETFGFDLTNPGTTNLLPDAFEKVFGFRPKKGLSDAEREICQNINLLFDDMQDSFGLQSWAIFSEVMGADAHKAHSRFLMNVATCPPEVLAFCQHELALNTERREAYKAKKAERQAKAEQKAKRSKPVPPP